MRTGRRPHSLTNRIFSLICVTALIVLAASLIMTVSGLYGYFSNILYDELESRTRTIARGVEKYGGSFLEDTEPGIHSIMWLDASGNVLFDTTDDSIDQDEREAFIEARREGFGEGMRILPSLTEKNVYSACRLSDGSVILITERQLTFFSPILGFIQRIIIITAGAVLLSFLLARLFAARIVRPVNGIDPSDPMKSVTYSEIMPFLQKIEAQRCELIHKQIEFEAATENMGEGLVILGADGSVLSANKAAAEMLSEYGDIRKDASKAHSLADSEEFGGVIGAAVNGTSSELIMTVGGEDYRVNASPVISEGSPRGAVLFFFSMTEHERAEKMRREFTANVSHELKTPLQSISGYAELIMNGMVKSPDIPKFGERIYSEAKRVTLLIDDIMKLSKLDEGATDMQKADVDLLAAAEAEVSVLSETACSSRTETSVSGDHAVISAFPSLVSTIIHNLYENAVKYNRPGGSVAVNVRDEGDKAVLTVSDTGIGIPPEHLDRIFERFYRVDKSRSKQVGGTGLGLAIVKHAVNLHGAEVSIESTPGVGTTVTVVFNK